MVIIIDNGLDFLSEKIVATCYSLGISLQHSTPTTPSQKGNIESIYQRFNGRWPHGNPTATIAVNDSKGDMKWE